MEKLINKLRIDFVSVSDPIFFNSNRKMPFVTGHFKGKNGAIFMKSAKAEKLR